MPQQRSNGADHADVDVVIPLYDKAPVLARAVRSVLAQTVTSWRLVIVDDGSTDGWTTPSADPRITVLRQRNAGPGAARNAGAATGSAPVLAFLDADDEWEPTFLAELLALLQNAPEAAAASSGWSGDRPAPLKQEDAETWRWHPSTPPAGFKARVDAMHTSGTVVRRAVFERLDGFYEHGCTYGEDSYLWAAVAMTAPIVRTPAPLIRFHTDFSSLSAGRSTPYPLPPLLVDSAVFRANVGWRWDAYMPAFLAHYADFVLRRSIDEGALRPVVRFFADGLPARLGMAPRDARHLLVACLRLALRRRAGRVRRFGRPREIRWS